MALGLIFVGALLLISAVRNQQGSLFSLVKQDLTGTGSFLEWALALLLVGAVGFIPKARPLSIALLALVLLGIVLKSGGGFFSQLSSAVSGASGQSATSSATATAAATASTATAVPVTTQSGATVPVFDSSDEGEISV